MVSGESECCEGEQDRQFVIDHTAPSVTDGSYGPLHNSTSPHHSEEGGREVEGTNADKEGEDGEEDRDQGVHKCGLTACPLHTVSEN